MNEVSKELERIKNRVILIDIEMTDTIYNECEDLHNSFCIIEKELKRLEEQDKIFKKYDIDDTWLEPVLYVIKNHFPMDTETQLRKLRVSEIIKKKKVNTQYFWDVLKKFKVHKGKVQVWGKTYTDPLEYYNKHLFYRTMDNPKVSKYLKKKYYLTQEEFDLLKEVLK